MWCDAISLLVFTLWPCWTICKKMSQSLSPPLSIVSALKTLPLPFFSFLSPSPSHFLFLKSQLLLFRKNPPKDPSWDCHGKQSGWALCNAWCQAQQIFMTRHYRGQFSGRKCHKGQSSSPCPGLNTWHEQFLNSSHFSVSLSWKLRS